MRPVFRRRPERTDILPKRSLPSLQVAVKAAFDARPFQLDLARLFADRVGEGSGILDSDRFDARTTLPQPSPVHSPEMSDGSSVNAMNAAKPPSKRSKMAAIVPKRRRFDQRSAGRAAGAKGFTTGTPAGKGTLAGCCTWARQPSSNSLTSLAEPNRRDGSFSNSRSTIAMNHGGNSGLSDASACGGSSTNRRIVAISRIGTERRHAAGHFVEHAAQAEQIGSAVERFPLGLFGRHILRRAGDDALARQRDVVGRARQAEIGEHGAFDSFFQQDVGRLHVAMHQSLLVSRRQTRRGLHADAENLLEFQDVPWAASRSASDSPATSGMTKNGNRPCGCT